MKSCYVSIAFGRKLDTDGREVDYDRIYHELIEPAVAAAGFECRRGDQFTGALIHKEIMRAVLTSDVMVADLSNGNPNVMYELGIRHALRRGVTVLLTSTRLPFNVSHTFAIYYQVGANGGPLPESVTEIQRRLTQALQQRVDSGTSDSPVYEYFPGLHAEFPGDLQPPQPLQPKAGVAAAAGRDSRKAVARAERTTRNEAMDEHAYAELMRRWMNLGAWGEVVRLAQELPKPLRRAPGLMLLEAQAHAQLGNPTAAIGQLSALVDQRPDDPEALSLLGSLLKQRHLETGSRDDLKGAIAMYRRAFDIGRQDLYLGRNLAQLLHAQDGSAAPDELSSLLSELSRLANHAVAEPPVDYWTLHSALVIAALLDDLPQAQSLATKMLAMRPEPWMLESSRNELRLLLDTTIDNVRRERLQALIASLQLSVEQVPGEAEDESEIDDA